MDYCLHNIHHNSPGSNNYLPQRGSKRFLENQKIVEKAREVYHKSRGPYGSPRIHASLHRLGIQCSRPRVARLIDLFRNRIKCHLKDGVMIFDRITGDEKKFRHLTGMNHHSPLFFKILNLKGINFLKSATDLIRRTRKELTEYFSC
ncbi:MAG: IS3 family transposase [Rhabdochlamydiaceae bacterium]